MTTKEPMTDHTAMGVVLGSQDATPLEFWIGVREPHRVQLDDVVSVRTRAGSEEIVFFGIVDSVRKRYEGNAFDSDAFRAADGSLPVEVSYAAHVRVTRIVPEVFSPPHPGDAVEVVRGEEYQAALGFDRVERRLPIGIARSGEPVFANLEFLDGSRGAHASISGVSGVATKTTYATFLLHALFNSSVLGTEQTNTRAIIFNVKGEDLLWLDRANNRLTDAARLDYAALGLPAKPFDSVGLWAPARQGTHTPMPSTGGRQEGVRPYLWTMREFAASRLLRFAFAESDDARSQVGFVIERVEAAMYRAAKETPEDAAYLQWEDHRLDSFDDLVTLLESEFLDTLVRGNIAPGTLSAFQRRLDAVRYRIGHLVRGTPEAVGHAIDWHANQVTVIDIHNLHATAQMFVVGVVLKRLLEEKESKGSWRPLVFVVLDELNKYAPRTGWSPLADTLLDIAERGRSLGVSLFGAQQTASEVERRVVSNASLKVVGRLDAAEAERSEYGFLTPVARRRATMLQPGSMIVAQPELPTPLLVRFPFPAWATRQAEADVAGEVDPFASINED